MNDVDASTATLLKAMNSSLLCGASAALWAVPDLYPHFFLKPRGGAFEIFKRIYDIGVKGEAKEKIS